MTIIQKKAVISIVDQGVVSVSNFLTGIIVAKALSPDQYGFFSLLFTGIFLISGLQNSLITGPLKILGMRSEGIHAFGLYKSHLIIQIIFGLSLILILNFLFPFFNSGITIHNLISFSVALFFFQLNELGRAIFFVKLDIIALFITDCMNHLFRLLLLIVFFFYFRLTPGTALFILATASFIGSISYIFNKDIYKSKAESLSPIILGNWNYGKWLLLETVSFSISSQIYLYLVAYWIDRQSAGAFNAVQNMLNTVNVLLIGIMSYTLPLARMRLLEGSYAIWRKLLVKVGVFLSLVTCATVFIISIFSKYLLALLYKPFYSNFSYLTYILSLFYILMAVNTVFSTAFQTANLPKVGFIAKFSSAVITLTLSYPLIMYFGIAGAAIGLVLTQCIWIIVYTIYLLKGTLIQDTVMKNLMENVAPISY